MSGPHNQLNVAATFPGASDKPIGPGLHGLLWAPGTSMPSQARHQWRERAVPVAVAAFDGTAADFWAAHWSDRELDRLSVLHVAADDTGAPAGWVSGRREGWGGCRVFYAASAGVAPHIQGGGLSGALWRRVVLREVLRAFPRPLYVVLRTGNPLVYDAWSAAAGDSHAIHPRPDVPVPSHIQLVASDAAEDLGQSADLDVTTLRIAGAYRDVPGGLWRDRPRSRHEQTNTWFDTTLQATDAFIVVARFTVISAAVRAITPRGHRP